MVEGKSNCGLETNSKCCNIRTSNNYELCSKKRHEQEELHIMGFIQIPPKPREELVF